MNTYLLTVLACIRSIITYCTSATWSPLVKSVPAFDQDITSLADKEKSISAIIKQQETKINGYTETRKKLYDNLGNVSYTQLRRGMAYAKKSDSTLLAKLDYPLSTIQRMPVGKIGTTMSGCYDALKAVPIATLIPFGITAASLQNWTDTIKVYTDFMNTPRTKMSERKALTEAVEESILDANDFLRTEVSYHAEAFITSDKLFYAGFKNNLRQIPVVGRHTQLDATLTSEIGPCFNCKVTIDAFTNPNTGKSYKAVFGYTDINGNCSIKEFEAGIRTVTVSGDSIETKTYPAIKFVIAKAVHQVYECAPKFNGLLSSKVETPKDKTSK